MAFEGNVGGRRKRCASRGAGQSLFSAMLVLTLSAATHEALVALAATDLLGALACRRLEGGGLERGPVMAALNRRAPLVEEDDLARFRLLGVAHLLPLPCHLVQHAIDRGVVRRIEGLALGRNLDLEDDGLVALGDAWI